MIDVPYSLIIEATDDPDYFGFYSPELEGFTGIGHSIEDCIYRAKRGMREHVDLLREQRLPVPSANPDPKIIVQNEKKNAAARSFRRAWGKLYIQDVANLGLRLYAETASGSLCAPVNERR